MMERGSLVRKASKGKGHRKNEEYAWLMRFSCQLSSDRDVFTHPNDNL
jgi:hypothetical protein